MPPPVVSRGVSPKRCDTSGCNEEAPDSLAVRGAMGCDVRTFDCLSHHGLQRADL